jgi:hypothetical protein
LGDVGLDASLCAAEIELCVAVVAVVRFGREPTIEVVPMAKKKSARLVGTFEYAIACRVLRENPVPWMLLSERFSCATAVMDTSARTPTITAARRIEYFSSILDSF